MVLLEVSHLSKSFPIESGAFRRRIGVVQALKDVSLVFAEGETLAVVGGSGCGKSTLAKIIAGLLEPDEGEFLWQGRPLASFSRAERAHRIQMIFQDPYASLNPKLSVGMQLAEVLRSSPEVSSASVSLLESVGLSADALSHYPFQFSGGQRQRIAIARALAARPRLLIADESLSALDVTTQAQILDLFKTLKAKQRLTLLFITHDLAVARQCADRVVVMQEGRMVEEGPVLQVLKTPHHTYTQALLNAVPKIPC
jgi:ABC-type glutathione transport system ATPase component